MLNVHTHSPQLLHSHPQWASKTWTWLEGSGMMNSQSLFNDGLDGNCKNNGGTTWTLVHCWLVANPS